MGSVTFPAKTLETDPVEAVELIRSFHPAALMGDVSVLSSFANTLIDMRRHARDVGLLAVATHAEMLLQRDREVIAQVFGCPVFDRYALSEVAGYVAQECEYHCGLHTNAGLAKVEVVRDGEVCGPGESGRLIVTNLLNYAMPFIRYDTGDLATVGEDCQCGRAFSSLSSIEGRSANWVITESFPVAWTRYLGALQTMSVESIERFQFVQTDVGRLTLLIAPKSPQNDARIEEIQARLNGVHPLVGVNVEAVDVIAEVPGRKRVLFRPLGTGTEN
jgi:phenylacetate-CoA ligase